MSKKHSADFEKAVKIGRPPNLQTLFPNSNALIVSGKVIDRAMIKKGKAMAIAANGRNNLVIRGALRAAQKANAALLIEIAKSEGGASGYCAPHYWCLARQVDALCNEMGITVPVAIHADHYGIKKAADIEKAKSEIPTIIDAGITSFAIDASHMPDDENLFANFELSKLLPKWIGYESEVGEIKGDAGLSTKDEALFLIQGLNAHGIFPDWIALNNGSNHGIQASAAGIDVKLTGEIHSALAPYMISGAQHGTSGNSSERLREIASKTNTTKANVATALQMISWGVEVNDYGNAELDAEGNFKKDSKAGVSSELWAEMTAYAAKHGWKIGDYKKLNLPFEPKLLSQPAEIRERCAKGVEDFVYGLLSKVFNAEGTAELAIQEILKAGSHDLGPKGKRIEDEKNWSKEKIKAGAPNKAVSAGNYDD